MTKDGVTMEHGESSKAPLVAPAAAGVNRAVAVVDVFLRFIAIIGTIGSAIAMGTTNETLPFFTQFIQFEAKYSDLPSFTANWFSICQQFDSFCERISGSLIGSFAAMVLLVVLITLSAFALARRH
uniref:CASP-like protein n=1 Tax=Oryza punctata TaxID=4537 RepID=A0A0E0KRG9_ORYPU